MERIIQKQGQTERDERERARERARAREQERHHKTIMILKIKETNMIQLWTIEWPVIEKILDATIATIRKLLQTLVIQENNDSGEVVN